MRGRQGHQRHLERTFGRAHARAISFRDLVGDDAEAIVKPLLTKAKDGDVRVALAFMDRPLPPLKAVEIAAELAAGLNGSARSRARPS